VHGCTRKAILQPVFFAALPDGPSLHEIRNSGDGAGSGKISIDGGGFCLTTAL